MSDTESIGSILDARNVRVTIGEGELISDAVVILRIVNSDGDTNVRVAWSDGMDWISRRGLLEVARDVERVSGGDDNN